MRDMIPPNDRSIRNIPVPAAHRRVPAPADVYEDDFTKENPPPRAPRPRRGGRGWFFWSICIVVALCAIGGVLLSTLFVHVTVHVALRHQTVTAPSSITAQLNPPVGGLAYAVVTAARTASTSVKANGTTQVSQSASGILTVYNDYSTAPQALVANTRFEAANGNIYRIHSDITIPGATKNADGTLQPGSTSVTTYADAPGVAYNISQQTQFTIPGFKGDPRYGKFYAQTSAMTGGFVGAQAAIAPSDLAAAQSALQSGLQTSLQNASQTDIPKEYTVIPGTLKTVYGEVIQSAPNNDDVVLSQTATATLNIVRTNDLASAIARVQVQNYNGEAVGFADPTALQISLASSSATTGPITLNLSGSPTLVWQFDADTLKAAMVGKSKSAFETIVNSFAPAIECTTATPCTASIRPFWKTTFPTDPSKISVISQ